MDTVTIPTQEIAQFLEQVRSDPSISPLELETVASVAAGTANPEVAKELLSVEGSESTSASTAPPPTKEDELPPDIRAQLAEATFGQKVKLAMLGNAICRMVLVRDPNKLIQQLVLRNPRITPAEIEDFARNKNLSDGVLRAIAGNKAWMKQYKVKLNLVCNPKTPGDLSLKWIRFLNQGDLKTLSRSKNVSNVVSVTARKLVQDQEGKN